MIKLVLKAGAASLMLAFSGAVYADKQNVFACEPEWAALVVELGGEHVNVFAATTALQDAHRVQARPSLIAKARNADLLICAGAELEVGWLPVLLRKSGNRAIQPGGAGYFMATDYVELLGKHDHVDRSMGDVHAAGNPHVATDPKRLLKIASALSQRLQKLDADHAIYYQQRLARLQNDFDIALTKWQPAIAAAKGKAMVVHHDSWLYLAQWLQLNKVATLEPKPGVPPSTGHLSRLLKSLRQTPANVIIYSSAMDPKPAKWLSGKTNTPHRAVPLSPLSWNKEGDLLRWYKQMLDAVR